MKKIILSLLIAMLLVSVTLLSCTNADDTNNTDISLLDVILETGVLKVGTPGDWIPMTYVDPSTGDYIGHDIDLVTKLAEDIGVEIEFVKTDWKSLATGIAAKRYHITTTGSYNMGRAKTAGYTIPITNVITVAMTQRSNLDRFQTLQDIDQEDVIVATTLGTVFDELVVSLFPNAQKTRVEAPAREFQELLTNKAQVSITDSIEAALLVQQYPELAVIPTPLPFGNVLGLLTPRNEQEFINYLNIWITIKRQEGFFEELEEKWLTP